jgi:signal transduction histidine kinase
VFIAATILLAVIAAGQVADRARLQDQYHASAQAAVEKIATDFEHHLSQLAEDARLIADVLWQTGNDPDYPPTLRSKVLEDGVRALSGAAHHCRGIAFSEDGESFEVALDPREDRELAAWLGEQGRKSVSVGEHAARLQGPVRAPGDRPFFLQVQHLPIGIVVAAVDARRLFESLRHGRLGDSRLVLVDAENTLWVGCSSLATCQALSSQEWNRDTGLREFMATRQDGGSDRAIPPRMRQLLMLPASLDMMVHWRQVQTGDGPITVGLLSSLSELYARRQVEKWRLLAIGAGMLLSAAIVGAILWRQRQREHALRMRLRHAEELNRLEHHLVRAEKLATVGVLAAGLAHELGTPLAIIRGRAEMLEQKTQWQEVKTILEQTDHIASTVRQVLDFSREQPVSVQPIDVGRTFRTVVSLLDFRLRAKQIDCVCEPENGGFEVAADPDQLQQVLVNLVLNACDACAHGGRIELRASSDSSSAGLVRIDIMDDGCGIPAAKLDAVFDPFYTTKPKGEGTGLGLPVAAAIVRNHRGQISIASSEGHGTTVSLLWPRKGTP